MLLTVLLALLSYGEGALAQKKNPYVLQGTGSRIVMHCGQYRRIAFTTMPC
jgi:hypothetical protein